MRGHFRSRDKDDGQSHENLMALCFILKTAVTADRSFTLRE